MEFIALSRKERIILTAIDIIDELGIQGLSVREVAKRQNMSNATMFNHFKSKTDLILAVLDHFTQFDSAIWQVIQSKGLKGKAAILYTIETYVTYYENYPAITSIEQAYDIIRREANIEEKVLKVLKDRDNFIKQMIDIAKKDNEICTDISSDNFADIILGTCRNICLKWRINNYNFSLKEHTIKTITLILQSFSIKTV